MSSFNNGRLDRWRSLQPDLFNIIDVGKDMEDDILCIMANSLSTILMKDKSINFVLVPLCGSTEDQGSISREMEMPLVPPFHIIGFNRNDKLEDIDYGRMLRRSVCVSMNEMNRLYEDKKSNSTNIPRVIVRLRRQLNAFLIRVECDGITKELSFEGSPKIEYHLGFECIKESIVLLSERDYAIYTAQLVQTNDILKKRSKCHICLIPQNIFSVFHCGHAACKKCSSQCKICSICNTIASTVKCNAYMYDTYCRYHNCFIPNCDDHRVNFPCECITCHDPDHITHCLLCEQLLDVSEPFQKIHL